MSIRIALAGNPNCGKTTLFNALTGSNQFVGNWPGVTVEKKEGKLKKHEGVTITDLPGIYSLSPYTLEEVVARNYLIGERPDAILNIIDGTNLERNLYLTTQLTELGIPVVVAINMMDVVVKNGDKINTAELSRALGCKVIEISALKGTGIMEAAEAAIDAAGNGKTVPMHTFSGTVEHALAHIEEAAVHGLPEEQQRWYAIKLFERDDKVLEQLNLSESVLSHIETDIKAAEEEMEDDAESIITNERYLYIGSIIKVCLKKKSARKLTNSDKIDKIVTDRFLGLPIFAAIMFLVYYISMVTVGASATDWANDGLFGDGFYLLGIGSAAYEEASEAYGVWVPGIPVLVGNALEAAGVADWLAGLINDGIVAGVGAVLGFVPQMLVLFLLLAFLEACGYMARIAFVLDRIFRKFGLSGKSFIPMLIGTGCGVPGIMASRTIENERDRRMTIMTTTFIPCGAKVPFISMVAGAVFGGSAWVATSAYFVGMAAIIISGIMLKKTKMFSGDPAPFVMELPAYHMPAAGNVLRSMWERGWSFIRKAGSIILLSTIVIWFMTYFGFTSEGFRMLGEEEMEQSLLAAVGSAVAWIFIPLGWGNWQAAVATITGLVAKENIVGTMSIFYPGGWPEIGANFSMVAGYSFLVFNLLCAPCFAAIGAIKREMNSAKWTWFAIGYQCGLAYAAALMVYQIGSAFMGNLNVIGLLAAIVILGSMIYMLFRPYKEATKLTTDMKLKMAK
ncbi:ferrous iron transport protein B [bacterium 0.1xD8-71]|nr:ferrous iron transport protein B [bacterium 0.1xD8-71]